MMWREQGKTGRRGPASIVHGLDASSARGTPAALRQLGHAGAPQRINVIRAREGARANLLRIAFDRLFDRGAELAEALDEFRHARRQPEHVLEHEDLAVAGGAGADADRRNGDLRGAET